MLSIAHYVVTQTSVGQQQSNTMGRPLGSQDAGNLDQIEATIANIHSSK
jgi:hypothetical protein